VLLIYKAALGPFHLCHKITPRIITKIEINWETERKNIPPLSSPRKNSIINLRIPYKNK
jgi:hypothetical protein